MDGIRRDVGADGSPDSETPTTQRAQIQAPSGRRAQARGAEEGFCGHRVCAPHGMPMEGAAEGIREREFGPQVFSRMEAGGSFCSAVAQGPGGI